MSEIIDKKPHSQLKISQSNELTEAAYYLPLQAKRVLWLCLMQTYREDEHTGLFTVKVADYQRYFKVSQATASTDVRKGIEELGSRQVRFFPSEGEYEEIRRPWLAEAGLKRGRGQWNLELNSKVMPYLIGLTSQFTTYTLLDCGKINSVRVIRLYESLCQFRSTGIWITTASWLAERYELPDSQKTNMAEMKRTFLVPAIEKINAQTPLKISMKEDSGKLIFSILSVPLTLPGTV
ncbi:replication initiation protein [Acerihabitans sp. TG2]|uniref:replication initiation protein n=1 Tax=Acerihabitans sp. TG2 TaxID=3096008 RepID=UPI002B23351E|nr:replication initiation protein [Acerihabitans sp. TG2]MEA9392655.1 replication initiation protein [Acerihabitans sp. TG2]